MKVLFDQGTPVPLREALDAHTVETAHERGWSTLGNGELLAAAEAEAFEVLVSTDMSLRYQQNLAARKIAVVVLTTTSWPRIRRHLPAVTAAVNAATSGSYTEVRIDMQ
jgi:predicted nuclease of predicted toxin-antitoxin system